MNSEPSYTVFIRLAFRRRSLLEAFDIIGLLRIRPNLERRLMEASKAGFVGLYRLHALLCGWSSRIHPMPLSEQSFSARTSSAAKRRTPQD